MIDLQLHLLLAMFLVFAAAILLGFLLSKAMDKAFTQHNKQWEQEGE